MERHIDPLHFNERLTQEEQEHLRTCRYCLEQLADHVENHELLTAPNDLKLLVMERCKRPDIQIIAGSNHVSKKLQLFYFSLKVSAAILCALTLLVAAPDFSKHLQVERIKSEYSVSAPARQWKYYEKASELAVQLNRLSNQNMEVFNHDKKKR